MKGEAGRLLYMPPHFENQMTESVSHAYLLGIREGRATMRGLEAQGFTVDIALARHVLRNVQDCLAMGFAGELRDTMKGERDFWANQCKRLAVKVAT